MFDEFDEFSEGIMFTYPVNQAVLFTFFSKEMTGKVLGQAPDKGVYIVLLDQPLSDTRALLVHEDDMKLLTCHFCRDTHEVSVTPFTIEQYNTNTIPTKPCSECRREEAILWATKA